MIDTNILEFEKIISGPRPVIVLACIGIVFGFAIEVAKFLGAVLRSRRAVIFAPLLTGSAIGVLQGFIIPAELWGFSDSVVYSSEWLRMVSGALCGAFAALCAIRWSLAMRGQL